MLEANNKEKKLSLESMFNTEFRSMALDKFCVKQHFEIGFANVATLEDEPLLSTLIELNRQKEDLTFVTFIEPKDVDNFITTAFSQDAPFVFPPNLLEDLKKFSEFIRLSDVNVPEIYFAIQAYCMKFTLIHTMYNQYAAQIKEMAKREELTKELGVLSTPKPMARALNVSKPSTSKSRRRRSDQSEIVELDLTDIAIKENELIVDDAVANQVYFYIFKGFQDIGVTEILLNSNVNLSFIVQVAKVRPDATFNFIPFWRDLESVKNSARNYLQNVALMKFYTPNRDEIANNPDGCLTEFINVLKSLIDLKRLHFKYIKNLKMVDTHFTEIFTRFPVYEKITNSYPLELVTVPLILNSAIQEVQMQRDKRLKSSSFHQTSKNSRKNDHTCVFNWNARPKISRETQKENENSFKIHESDILNLTLKSYENVDVNYVEDHLSILKIQRPLMVAKECEFNISLDNFRPHRHHVSTPSRNDPILTNEQENHIINLLYLKYKRPIGRNNVNNRTTGEFESWSNEFTKNLIVHNELEQIERCQPRCIASNTWLKRAFSDEYQKQNVYEKLNPLTFHWTERMKPEVLYQNLLNCELNYISSDYIPCEMTDSLLIRFHNEVNSFGLNTKVWTEYLRTPIALADFCHFTLIDDYEWISRNPLKSQTTYVEEVERADDRSALKMYFDDANSDYKTLLVPMIQFSQSDIRKATQCPCIEDSVCKVLEEHEKRQQKQQQQAVDDDEENDDEHENKSTTNMKEILEDLTEYESVKDYSKYCKRKDDKDFSFIAYNFGTSKFRIKGHTTNFISLDDVKVTVDSSRFFYEPPKLTTKIEFDENSIVFHTKQTPTNFNFHMILHDGTIICVMKPLRKPGTMEQKLDVTPRFSDETFNEFEKKFQIMSVNSSISKEDSALERIKDKGHDQFIVSTDSKHYDSLELYPRYTGKIREHPIQIYKRDIDREIHVLKRLRHYKKCLKISCRRSNARRNVPCLEKKIPELEINVGSIAKRIINNPAKKKSCQNMRKCVVTNGDLRIRINEMVYDYVVTVPNGLSIKILPSEIASSGYYVIRQAYDYAPGPREISFEKYRIFTGHGTIIIGRRDGTIVLLTSNGNEIRFEKPIYNMNEQEKFCKPDAKLDHDFIRKMLTRLISETSGQSETEHFVSRRGHLHTKIKSISSWKYESDLSQIPFATINLISIEGTRYKIKNEKLMKSLYSHHKTEINFSTSEKTFKRYDGLESRFEKDGSMFVQFPDGTRITTRIVEECLRLDSKDPTGWILITSHLIYEHPFYKPVFFNNSQSNMEIRINENDRLCISKNAGMLRTKNATLNMHADQIQFRKKCFHCESEYKCDLNVDPLYRNTPTSTSTVDTDTGSYFIEVEDSYDKRFKADYCGNCKVIPKYIPGAVNKNGCRFHATLSDHQKIFLVKNDLTGMMLWDDEKVSTVMEAARKKNAIFHANASGYMSISKNVYSKYTDRFRVKRWNEDKTPTGQSSSSSAEHSIIYQTVRNFHNVFELEQIERLIAHLKNIFDDESMLEEFKKSLNQLKCHIQVSKSVQVMPIKEESHHKRPLAPKPSVQDKLITIYEKDNTFKRILRAPIPCYFHSPVCTYEPARKVKTSTQKI